jgi:uncharacterized protein with GYD domain
MAKFLWKANYTTEGAKGILTEGGTGRRAAVEQMTEALGGKVEAFYYAFGGDDVYVITELPDNTSAAAVSLAVNAAGAVRLETVQLLTAEEMDEATKKSVEYRPPGG